MAGSWVLNMAASWGSHGVAKLPGISTVLWLSNIVSTPEKSGMDQSLPETFTNATVRSANGSDFIATADVACAGFKQSPVLIFQRPDFKRFENDTLTNYKQQMHDELNDPDTCVFVVLDSSGKIAGVASVTRPKPVNPDPTEDMVRFEKIVQENKRGLPAQRPQLKDPQDVDKKKQDEYDNATIDLKKKASKENTWKLQTLVMDPTHKGRHGGSVLLEYCCKFADYHNAHLWVSAAPASHSMLGKAGFNFESDMVVRLSLPGDKNFQIWIGDRKPNAPIDLKKARKAPVWFDENQYGAKFGEWEPPKA